MRKLEINYTKNGKVISITEKDNWSKIIIEKLILGLILFFLTYWITNALNPNPIIEKSCYKKDELVNFVLYNPARAPAEDFNMIVFERYGGGGKSYADNELCSVDVYDFQPLYTLIRCNYIPPGSSTTIGVNFYDENQSVFKYSSWGKTTPKEDFEEGHYLLSCKSN